MAQEYEELQAMMSADSQTGIKNRTEGTACNLGLGELREERQLTQTYIAHRMSKNQGTISKMERRTGMHLSTLRGYIEALGGRLELVAVFPDGKVHVLEVTRNGPPPSDLVASVAASLVIQDEQELVALG
jgi:hypothetical protein